MNQVDEVHLLVQEVNEQFTECQLCHQKPNQVKTFETISRCVDVCENCLVLVVLPPVQLAPIIDKKIIPYNIEKGNCWQCNKQNCGLYMLPTCSHYFCDDCCRNISKTIQKQCFKCKVQQDDYFAVLWLDTIQLLKLIPPVLKCPKGCQPKLDIKPHGKFTSLQLQISSKNQGKIHCKECQTNFCGKCWQNHSGSCQFVKIFEQYKKLHKVLKCPKCNVLVEPVIQHKVTSIYLKYTIDLSRKFKNNIQYCPMCNNTFCYEGRHSFTLLSQQGTCEECYRFQKSFFGTIWRLYQIKINIIIFLFVVIILSILQLVLQILSYAFFIYYETLDRLVFIFVSIINQILLKIPDNFCICIIIYALLLYIVFCIALIYFAITFIPWFIKLNYEYFFR